LLKGHERSITQVKYNLDGDLVFSASKDNKGVVWYADSGERLGTYGPHFGAVWDIDPNWNSTLVLTACADRYARLFELTTGRYICKMNHDGVVRACKWGDGNELFATASDPFTSRDFGFINIFTCPIEGETEFEASTVRNDPAPFHQRHMGIPVADNDKAVCLGWTIADQHILAGFDSGYVVKYDVVTGKEVMKRKVHNERVNRLNFSRDKAMFITASKDCSSKLLDPNNLEVIKEYQTDRPVNGVAISPSHPHVLLGGGQDAQMVTTTSASQGKFETRFFHMVYGEEFGRVRGHFGPINALDVHPFGRSYASGSEDGFIRLHHFDYNYLSMPDFIPTELK
jgi:translation initiation factor 3 subunit I